MRSCIVFAVSIFNEEKLNVLTEFLDTFKLHFSDCDMSVGINYGSIEEVERVLASYDLPIQHIRITDKDLYTGSDAGAYQAALSLLKASNKQYDVCWFAHTKGAVNNRPVERGMYLSNLFRNRIHIENLFQQYDKLGSYALRGVSRGAGGDAWSTFNRDHHIGICSNEVFSDFKYTHVNWSYIETMYVINGKVVQSFLDNTSESYYTTAIKEPCYFEVIFPWIVGRCGYFPYIKQSECFWREADLRNITQRWIDENNLSELQPYLSI